MSADKYSSIFSRQMKAIDYLTQEFFNWYHFLLLLILYFSFFKEKEKLMGEIQKRAHLLKKQQEAQSALKSKIKVSWFITTVTKSGMGSFSSELLVNVINYILSLQDKACTRGLRHLVKDLFLCLFFLKRWWKANYWLEGRALSTKRLNKNGR